MSDRPAVFVATPEVPWRALDDALAARGLEVYALHSGRPSYNWFAQFMGLEETHRRAREVVHLARPGLIDLQKTCRAVDASGETLAHANDLGWQIARAYALRKTLPDLFDAKRVDAAVVTCTYDATGRTVVACARDAGMPVVHVAHGCQTAAPGDAWYAADDPGDVVCVPGERDREWWATCLGGTARARETTLEVTGHPQWDRHWSAPFSGTRGAPTVLWACESGENAAQTPRLWASRAVPGLAWRAFLEAVHGLHDFRRDGWPVRLILKARGGEDPVLIERWLAEAQAALPGTSILATNQEPAEVLPLCDVVVCQDSNLGVEALIRGIPVVSVTRDGGGLFDRGVPVASHDPRALEAHVRAALESPPRPEEVRGTAGWYCRPGGEGADRVCSVIEAVASEGVHRAA